jgi:Rha family phage regulatory protein
MNQLPQVFLKDGIAYVDSREIAVKFGKEHKNVLQGIDSLEMSDEFRRLNFQLSSYQTAQNKTMPCFHLTERGYSRLVMSFTGEKAAKWIELFIEAFDQMKTVVKTPAVSRLGGIEERLDRLEAGFQRVYVERPQPAIEHGFVDSREFAASLERRHDRLLTSIKRVKKLVTAEVFKANFKQIAYLDSQYQKRPCYQMNGEGLFLVMMCVAGKEVKARANAFFEAHNAQGLTALGGY